MAKNDKTKSSDSEGKPRNVSDRRMIIKPLAVLIVLLTVCLTIVFFLTRRNEQASPGQAGAPPSYGSKPVITTDGWTRGNPNAKTVLVEFGDFQCPSCAMARFKVAEVLKKHQTDLKVVFKDYPMQNVHRNAFLAAQAAEAAGRQGKFWEMSESLFAHQTEWSNVPDPMTFFMKYASELQLDPNKFRTDMMDNEIRNKIFRDILEGQLAQVRSVPTFFLNGNMMENLKSEADFQQQIDNAIQSAR